MSPIRFICSLPVVISFSPELPAQQAVTDPPPRLEFVNGQWFNGREFHPRTLYSADGVLIAVGSDQFSKNSVDELLNLASLGVFDNATLLTMLCEVTPQSIFPERRIGLLRAGCEARFPVLRQNPLHNLENLRDIQFRLKRGLRLTID